MFRDAVNNQTKLGKIVEGYMNDGALVPDEITIKMLLERLDTNQSSNNLLLDGFPRTITQANGITAAKISIDYVIEIAAKDDEIIKRMSGRRVHLVSGRTYHVEFNPPKIDGKDDETGDELIQRVDDQESTVRKRLDVYRKETEPLIDYYNKLSREDDSKVKYLKINGMKDVKYVTKDILSKLL